MLSQLSLAAFVLKSVPCVRCAVSIDAGLVLVCCSLWLNHSLMQTLLCVYVCVFARACLFVYPWAQNIVVNCNN